MLWYRSLKDGQVFLVNERHDLHFFVLNNKRDNVDDELVALISRKFLVHVPNLIVIVRHDIAIFISARRERAQEQG